MSPRAWVLGAVYVAAAVCLALASFPGNGTFSTSEAVLFVVTLPALVVGLPLVYLAGATAWDVADAGGPAWVVPVVYACVFGVIAAANVRLVVWVLARRARRAVLRTR